LAQSERVSGDLRSERSWWVLPGNRALSDSDFRWRLILVSGVLALHVPVLLVLGMVREDSPARGVVDGLIPLVLLLVAVAPRRAQVPRRLRACAAALGLVSCSALLVHLFPTQPELHIHYFVAIAAVALFQEWAVYAVALSFVAVQDLLVGPPQRGGVDDWGLAGLYLGFLVVESAVLVLFWHVNEVSRAEEERLRLALDEGKQSVRVEIERTDQIRADLIGTVSHEFRTPLTGIRGAALTLLKRGGKMNEETRQQLLRAVLEQQERLSRLLENMLTAAQATAADPSAAAEVEGVAAEVVMLAGAARPECPAITVAVESQTHALIDRQALHQVLANLIDNAQQHGAPGAIPVLAGGTDDEGVWLSVSNEGTTLDSETARMLFEPFTQADTSATRQREGLGMGLYVVRRLVEVYGGSIRLVSEGGWTTVELRLRSADLDLDAAAGDPAGDTGADTGADTAADPGSAPASPGTSLSGRVPLPR
jgi:signal transduction histidine kinase